MKKGKVYSVHAQEAGKAQLADVQELLTAIDVQMQKFDSIRDWEWGNVGDLGHIEEVLSELYGFIVEAD